MQRDICIGIDLGTTYSCAAVWRGNRIDIIPNDQGSRTTPSYIAFTPTERFIGEAAKNQAARNPQNTVFDAKRLIGKNFNDPMLQNDMRLWPFKVIPSAENKPLIQVTHQNEVKTFYPEEISAMVLVKIKEMSEAYLGRPVRNAVITVPAHFNNAQRKATKDAGIIAGLNVKRILNEPTAAAIAYGLDHMVRNTNVLIVDIGGGTYDVSVLNIDTGVIEVLATAGNSHFGGEDFDSKMVEYCAEDFYRKTGINILSNPRALRRLRTACERAKRILSTTAQAAIEIECLADSIDYYTTITRAKFEELNMDYFRACTGPIQAVLSDINLHKRQVNEIVLVGGSTRIPKIQQIISEFFEGKELCRNINPDEAVAVGAAVHAAIIQGEDHERLRNLVLIDVIPLSLGLETTGGAMTKIIPRNTPFPIKKTQVFSTHSDNAESVTLHVYEGERPLVRNCNFLGSFTLGGIPKLPRGIPQIEVTFEVDANGILNVSAVDKITNKTGQFTVSRDRSHFTPADIERMCREAEIFSQRDKVAREKLDAFNVLEGMIYDSRFVIEKLLVEDELKRNVQKNIQEALGWIEANQNSSIEVINAKILEFKENNREVLEKFASSRNEVLQLV